MKGENDWPAAHHCALQPPEKREEIDTEFRDQQVSKSNGVVGNRNSNRKRGGYNKEERESLIVILLGLHQDRGRQLSATIS